MHPTVVSPTTVVAAGRPAYELQNGFSLSLVHLHSSHLHCGVAPLADHNSRPKQSTHKLSNMSLFLVDFLNRISHHFRDCKLHFGVGFRVHSFYLLCESYFQQCLNREKNKGSMVLVVMEEMDDVGGFDGRD